MKTVYFLIFGICLIIGCSEQPEICECIISVSDTIYINNDSDLNTGWLPGEDWFDKRDSISYKTVKIGNQVWMAENLKTIKYNNGDDIMDGRILGDYSSFHEPKYWFTYNDDITFSNEYGLLYTWYTVIDERGICPTGWHIPSDEEWKRLEENIETGPYNINSICDTANNLIAGALKISGNDFWRSPNKGAIDNYGFSAKGAGYRRQFDKEFNFLKEFACFWSSTPENEDFAWYRHLYNDSPGICRTNTLKNFGFSVRCVKD